MSLIATVSVYFELTLIPIVFVLLLYTGYHIIRRNVHSNINRYVGIALFIAALAIPGTLVRTLLSYYQKYYLLGEFERTWRHIDLYLAFYFYFLLVCGFWLLLKEPETPLNKYFFVVGGAVFVWGIIDIFFISPLSNFHDYATVLILVLFIMLEFVAIIIIIRYIHIKSTPSKKRRMMILGIGSVTSMVGFLFLAMSGFLRLYEQYLDIAILFESICAWLLWGASTILFYKGMPTKEAYFFDELNQSIVYNLQLPITTTLDDIFNLIENQLNITKQEIENRLKMERSIANYINELASTLKNQTKNNQT